MRIDLGKLPARALVDTSVLVYAFGHPKNADPDTRDAVAEFFVTMQGPGHRILIAAPSLAEMIAGNSGFRAPRTLGIEIVDFDSMAAETLAQRFPKTVLHDARAALQGVTAGYIKFDALIVACALRHSAECLLSLDPGQARLARHAGMPHRVPTDFLAMPMQSPQMNLDPPPGPPRTS